MINNKHIRKCGTSSLGIMKNKYLFWPWLLHYKLFGRLTTNLGIPVELLPDNRRNFIFYNYEPIFANWQEWDRLKLLHSNP